MVKGSSLVKPHLLPALALIVALPADAYGQAKLSPSWLECFSPSECEVRVFRAGWHNRKGRLRLLAERAASTCQVAGYSHYVAGAPISDVRHLIQRVYFTHDDAPPARPCSFSASPELEAEAKEMARVNGYSWPVGQVPLETEPSWTFEPGENDWGEAVPFLDEIASPFVSALRSDQDDLVGSVYLTRDCSATLTVGRLGAEPGDWWAYTDGQSGYDDRVLEVRVDGATVKNQGQRVTIPTAGLVASSERTFGVAVRSAEYEDNAAFEWTVADRDRATIKRHFPHCVESP